jgi:RHS repeat-associated protein
MPSLRFLALRLLAIVMLLGWSSVRAQITNVDNTTSTPIPGTGHDYIHLLSETVNPSNGSVSLRIELPMPKGRGISLPFSIGYDSNSLHHLVPMTYPFYGQAQWQANKSSLGQGGWSYSLPAAGLISTDVTEGSYPNYYTCTLFSNYLFHDSSGSLHPLQLASYLSPNGPCVESPIASGGDAKVHASLGNNGWQYGNVTVFSADGTVYQFNSAGISNDDSAWSFPDYIEDRNGNKITHTANSFVDTLGRSIISWDTLLGSSATPTNLTAGGLSYQITWKTATSNFSSQWAWVGPTDGPNSQYGTCISGFPNPGGVSQTVISQITLPNGKKFTFYYGTDNPDPAFQNPYGQLSEIDYPDGGWVKYKWKLSDTMNELLDYPGVITGYCAGTSMSCPKPSPDWCLYQYKTPVVASRSVGFGGSSTAALTQTFIYTTNWASTPSGYAGPRTWLNKSSSVNTTDNVTSKTALTTYSYTPIYATMPPYSHTNIVPQLPVESNIQYFDWGNTSTPLRTVTKTWYNQFTLASELTALETGQSSKAVFCYAGTGCDPRYNAPPFPQLIEKDEYDFGASSPTRKTLITYQNFSGTPGIIGHRPCKVLIQNGSSTTVAETDYYYDGNASLCATISSAVATGGPSGYSNHDGSAFSTSATTPRGNATKIAKKCLQGCSDSTTTFSYDEAGSVLSRTDSCGITTCSDMTGTNQTTTYSYADNFDSNPSTSTYAYLTKITDPLGHISKFKYAYSDGQLIQSQNQNDTTASRAGTTYLYNDSLRRLTETDFPDGGKTTVSYSDTAPSPSVTTTQLVTSSPALSISTTSVMDGMGHVAQTQLTSDPDGATYTDLTYDGFGRVRTQSNPHRSAPTSTDGITTSFYDALGRPCLVVPPDGTLPSGNSCPASQSNNTIWTTYSGNTTTVTDQAGKSRKSVTDGLGRLTTVFEDPSALNYETDYTYDMLDNVITVTQKGGSANSANWRTRTFTYNSLSRLTQAVNPESGSVSYVYDANGNLSTKTSPKPNQTGTATVVATYTYDVLNRLSQKSFNDGITPTVKYGYDGVAITGCTTTPPTLIDSNPIGSRTSMCDGAGAESWKHDSMGRVWSDARTTNGLTATNPYTYNLDGSIKTVAYGAPGSSTIETITFTQGGAGRYVSETSLFGSGPSSYTYVSAANYTPNGTLCSLASPNHNERLNVSFNNRFQPQHWHFSETPWGGNPAPPACQPPTWSASWVDLNYNYVDSNGHNNGNVTKITNNINHGWSQNFTYDSLSRIATAQTDAVAGNQFGCFAETYTYDAWGNLLNNAYNPTTQSAYTGCTQEAPSNLAGVVQPNNRLSGFGFTTDSAGNLIADGVHTFTYDAENHLLSTAQTGQTTVSYKYDGDGKRVQKSSGTLYWYGLSGQPLVETTLTGGTNFAYYYFNGHLVSRRDWANGGVFTVGLYMWDALGNTRISANGYNANWDYSDYYPFGGEWVHSANVGNHYKFTGKERDPESNLDNFGARYDSSSIGRFISADPGNAGAMNDDPQSWNAYAYARNNPLLYGDPNGQKYQICDNSGRCSEISDKDFNDNFLNAKNVLLNGNQISIQDANGNFNKEGTFQRTSFDDLDAQGNAFFNEMSARREPSLNAIKVFAVRSVTDSVGGAILGKVVGAGVEAIQAIRGASEAAAETTQLVTQAATTVGNKGAVASSEAVATQTAEEWVGIGAKPIYQNGVQVGKISADGTRVYRTTSLGKPEPYINLIRRTPDNYQAGNLHVRW